MMLTDDIQANQTHDDISDSLPNESDDLANSEQIPYGITTNEPKASSEESLIRSDTATITADGSSLNRIDMDQDDVDQTANSEPSMAVVSAIVNEVMRQKQIAKIDTNILANRELKKCNQQEEVSLVAYAGGHSNPYQVYINHESALVKANEQGSLYPDIEQNLVSQMPVWNSELHGENKLQVVGKTHIDQQRGIVRSERTSQDLQDIEGLDEFDDICKELGVSPATHPQLYSRKYRVPMDLFHNSICQYCIILFFLFTLSISIALFVIKGFEHVEKHNSQLNPYWIASSNDSKSHEQLKWWLENGGNITMNEIEFETLAYSLEDAYLPIWFDRKSGWKGQTYSEATAFCKSHDSFVICPFEVYCPGNGGKLIEGTMTAEISWAPISDEVNGWVQIGDGGKECDIYSRANKENPTWGITGEGNEQITRHIMCCLKTALTDDELNSKEDSLVSTEKNVSSFTPVMNLPNSQHSDKHLNSDDIDEWYLEKISEIYKPKWYDRLTGWQGSTYKEAISFCMSKNNKVPCPYNVYCPKGPTGEIIFDGAFDEGDSWAATGDKINQFVQVGKEDQCNRYSTLNPSGDIAGIDVTAHILCCDDILADSQATDLVNLGGITSNATASSTTSSRPTLTAMEHEVKVKYLPFWFDFNDGWDGSTYDSAKMFCESLEAGRGDKFHLCPQQAYCPNGPLSDKPLFIQKEAYEEEQWSPTSLSDNAWILVGKLSEKNPETCHSYLEINQELPSWGLDGSNPGIKKHILCCKGYLDVDGEIGISTVASSQASLSANAFIEEIDPHVAAASQSSIQGMPNGLAIGGGAHTGAGNSSPHVNSTVVSHLHPTWYTTSEGWNGGSYDDAVIFCGGKTIDTSSDTPMQLCPYNAYCPKGPTTAAYGDPSMSFRNEEQYSPYLGGASHWVLIGKYNQNSETTCLDYLQLFEEQPVWGTDDSMKVLKKYILCCLPSEIHTPTSATVLGSSSTTKTEYSKSQMMQGDKTSTSSEPVWFSIPQGWKGGSHTDAIKFCNNQDDSDGVPLELCPYEVYCPDGPSQPVIGGNSNIGINEESEQWSPTLSKANHWVLVGPRGRTVCMDANKILGMEPTWGLDGSNDMHKHHVLCCPLG